jgi:hypothetical protein
MPVAAPKGLCPRRSRRCVLRDLTALLVRVLPGAIAAGDADSLYNLVQAGFPAAGRVAEALRIVERSTLLARANNMLSHSQIDPLCLPKRLLMAGLRPGLRP